MRENRILFETRPEVLHNKNPMVRIFGIDEQGRRCKACKRLFRFTPGANSYFKCELRPLTRGPASDHRANWQACAKFEEEA